MHVGQVRGEEITTDTHTEELDFTIEVNDIDAKGKVLINEFYYKFLVNSTADQKVKLGENIK
ncbi:hypothetical protein ACTXT7_014452 [Hymenolepis weldensis]